MTRIQDLLDDLAEKDTAGANQVLQWLKAIKEYGDAAAKPIA